MLSKADPSTIAEAADVIRKGGLVIVPTETVYGLAADALNPDAVRKIFQAKGRPAENPLICHVYGEDVGTLAQTWPQESKLLAEAFWPGPLTMVLPKKAEVPSVTTGGLDTVAIRMPSHPVFRELIRQVGKPLAAPSANLFMSISPTSVENLDPELIKRVDMVLDGGPCQFGIESTVLDLSGQEPALLRPGSISKDQIERVLGRPILVGSSERKSPGMYPRHYAPKAKVHIVEEIGKLPGLTIGEPGANQIPMPREANEYAARLYSALHEMDQQGLQQFFVEAPPRDSEWTAIWDRLKRASSD